MTQDHRAWQIRLHLWKWCSGSHLGTVVADRALAKRPDLAASIDVEAMVNADLDALESPVGEPPMLEMDTGDEIYRVQPREFVAIETNVDWVDGPHAPMALTPSGAFPLHRGSPSPTIVLIRLHNGAVVALASRSLTLKTQNAA